RVLSGDQAGADPLDPRRRPERHRQPAFATAKGRRPGRGCRGHGQQRADRRPDPREQDRGDPRRDHGRRLLSDADLRAGADRARRQRRHRSRDRRERRHEPARLRGRARACAQASGRGGHEGRRAAAVRSGRRRAGDAKPAGRTSGVMKRILVGLALAAVSVGGTASADTFRVLPSVPASLPSASVPNQPGQVSVPTPISSPPAVSQSLNFQQLVALWQSAGSAYGIPWEVLASINKVESNFGRNMGPSSAGAVGWMQFMPSTWERWGVDANGDGVADPWNPEDAIYAAARYLAASGGAQDISRAVLSYNHAQWYVDEVLQLAHTFGSGGVDTTFE